MTVLEEKQNWKIKNLLTSKLFCKWHWKLMNCTIHCATSSIWHVNNKIVLNAWGLFRGVGSVLTSFFLWMDNFSSIPISYLLIVSVDFFFVCWECHQVEKTSEQLKFDLDHASTWILQDIWASISDFSWCWNTGSAFWLNGVLAHFRNKEEV